MKSDTEQSPAASQSSPLGDMWRSLATGHHDDGEAGGVRLIDAAKTHHY